MNAQLPRVGDIVGGKYVLETLIGQGGMGAVFKARHMELDDHFAIKVMFADAGNVEAATRFKNEGKAARRIKNPHVMQVYDVGQEFNYLYMVLELLEGEDLAQVLDNRAEKRIPYAEVARYVSEALEGVAQAHQMGIVHRDLKPSNLYLAKEQDGSSKVKVLDFGISKASNANALNQSPSALTSTKAMLGSPLYMSPEQLRSSKNVDARADIWAIGIILYELITGTLPFMGDNLGELFAAILEMDAPSCNARGMLVPPEFDQIVMRCLKRRPEDRFQSARELLAAIRPFAIDGAGTSPYAMSNYAPSGTAHLGAITPSGSGSGRPPGMASTPNNFSSTPGLGGPPRPPTPGAITGGGSAPRQIGGTVALGAVTPQQQMAGIGGSTSSSWQAPTPVVPKANGPVIVGVLVGFLALAGIGAFAAFSHFRKDPTTANPPPSATVSAEPTASTPPTTTVASATPSASAAPSATESATVASATKPVVTHNGQGTWTPPKPTGGTTTTVATVVKVDPPAPTPVKVDPPKPKPPTNTSGGVNTR